VDFAIGTDCGGSIRVPASYCGIFGIRPTHGRIPLRGAIPFAPSFDVVGWFARDPEILERVGSALFEDEAVPRRPTRVSLLADGFSVVEAARRGALEKAARRLGDQIGGYDEVTVSPEGLDIWRETFQVLQAAEIWANHRAWIREVKPKFGPGVKERFEWAATIHPDDVRVHAKMRDRIRAKLDDLLRNGSVLCLPTSPRAAPLRNTPIDTMEITYRNQAMCLLAVAGLGGLPQISMPIVDNTGLPPIGLSLIGARGTDMALLMLARELSAAVS